MRRSNVLAALLVALGAAQCLAEMPQWSQDRPQAMSVMQRGGLLSGANWWSRYGEPVNATAMSQAETSPSDKGVVAGPMPVYGDGYAFGPGSCDCSPPCIWGLWAGYFQNPRRCHPGHLHRHCGCGACGACGGAGACGDGCGLFGRHGGKACATSCTTSAACGCTTPVTCTTAAPSCGCKPVCGKCRRCHLGGHFRGFTAHWHGGCNSCSSALGCGCTTPVEAVPYSDKQTVQGPPVPLPEESALFPLPRLN
jgi:hypothetical protein